MLEILATNRQLDATEKALRILLNALLSAVLAIVLAAPTKVLLAAHCIMFVRTRETLATGSEETEDDCD